MKSVPQFDEQLKLQPIGLALADRLQAAIVREKFEPGEKLREEAICMQFGVSRSPLREAFQILENRGLVERRPRLGTRVTELSVQNLNEITQCRAPLEAACAGLLAGLAHHKEIAAVLEIELDAMRLAQQCGDLLAGFEANVRLTKISHERCENSVLMRTLNQLDVSALRYRYRAFRQMPEMLLSMIENNKITVAQIREGNVDAARKGTEELVWTAWEKMRLPFIKESKEDST